MKLSGTGVLTRAVKALTDVWSRRIGNRFWDVLFHSLFQALRRATNVPTDQHTACDQRTAANVRATNVPTDQRTAFDTVDHQILLNKLYHYGIRGVANNLLRSYLNNRKQFVFVNQQKSNLNTIKCGVPQGSTLGPIVVLIFINDLPVITKCKSYLFADDTTLLVSHSNTAHWI